MKIYQLIKIILIISILSSCASIPGNNVKLKDYPEFDNNKSNQMDIVYKNIDFEPKKDGKNFNHEINQAIEKQGIKDKNISSNCIVKISSNNDYGTKTFCKVYGALAGFTLFIVPAYCINTFEAKATLVSTSDNKVLKEYYLKDKAHEVWSLLWFVADVIIPPLRKVGTTPENAAYKIEQTISEALTRQILNDAATFPECQKK